MPNIVSKNFYIYLKINKSIIADNSGLKNHVCVIKLYFI